jgi:hypothetical protein
VGFQHNLYSLGSCWSGKGVLFILVMMIQVAEDRIVVVCVSIFHVFVFLVLSHLTLINHW